MIVVAIPGVKVVSEPNTRSHWAAKKKRVDAQKQAVRLFLNLLGRDVKAMVKAAKRVRVQMVRVSGKKMDSDNLDASFKAIRDTVAAWAERDDGDEGEQGYWDWARVKQESGPVGIRIELEILA